MCWKNIFYLFFAVSEFRLRCVCHVMNNVAEVGVGDDLKIVSRIREMVKFVRKPEAEKQYIALRESEKDKDKDRHLRLPLDVSTRWNSTLPMLCGAYEARHHLKRNPISKELLRRWQPS
ncbi:hypothetical protein RvY_12297-2 [Ramazzottius varieornatus]|uniref:HAT C-terminal dimerisation domain-containing protein n=1 Tax=Ramazzottius varieornatus TaxID=947166 RepID=A0A1D1VSR9_RAMVA|nr:hypothetical protein RvY_12297-2 [Ramazzottius varieornatus]